MLFIMISVCRGSTVRYVGVIPFIMTGNAGTHVRVVDSYELQRLMAQSEELSSKICVNPLLKYSLMFLHVFVNW